MIGIGSVDSFAVLAEEDTAHESSGVGLLQAIDVVQSLATRQAVPVGESFAPESDFALTGGVTGVPASDTFYAAGYAAL